MKNMFNYITGFFSYSRSAAIGQIYNAKQSKINKAK